MKSRGKLSDSFKEGALYGIILAATGYMIVHFFGYNPWSLAILLYLYILSSILINVKSEISAPLIPLLKRLTVVIEGEEMKLKRLLTGEEYRIQGEVEKL